MIGMMYLVLTAMLALNVSKDILDGFTRVDDSLHSSIDATYNRNQTLYFEFKAAYEQNPEKTRDMYDKAGELRRKSNELYDYIQDYKVGLVTLADGENVVADRINTDEHGDPTRNITNKDNKDVTGQYTFVEQAEDGRTHGEHLKEEIAKYREFLCALVREHDPQLEGQYSSLFSTDDIFNKNDHRNEEWTHATFDEVPICASITLLTKIQNDIRASEGQMIKYLKDRTDAADLRVNSFKVYVNSESDYVMKGSKYRANIILAAVDSTRTPRYVVDGKELGPDGVYEIVTTTAGQKKITGELSFLNNEGELQTYPFEHEYSVGEPSASVSNLDMDVIYQDFDNKFRISVPGFPSSKVRAVVEGKTLQPDGKGDIIVKTNAQPGSKVNIVVQADLNGDKKMVTMGTQEYTVKQLPKASGFVKYQGVLREGNRFGAATLLSDKTEIAAAYGPDVLIKVDFELISFETNINGVRKSSSGNHFSKDQANQIKKLKAGSTIWITNAKYRPAKGGDVRFIPDFAIILN